LLNSQGPEAKENPFRFSSEYFDDETGTPYDPATQCCCNGKVAKRRDILREKQLIIIVAQAWNTTSPTWSWGNQCEEQSIALIDSLDKLKSKYWTTSTIFGYRGVLLTSWLGAVQQHNIVNVTCECTSGDCGCTNFAIDPYKGKTSVVTIPVYNPPEDYVEVDITSEKKFRDKYPHDENSPTVLDQALGAISKFF
jgi:hypothetical protein